MQPARGEITVLLAKWKNGEPSAFEDLMPLVYPHLREVAAAYVRRERNPDLLQGTALVHELYLRLLNQKKAVGEDRRHFYAFAAKVMRMILIDHAREMQTQMRGGDRERIPLSDDLAWIDIDSPELLDLNRALDELAALDANKVQLVELRYFLGCTTEEAPRRPSQAAGAGKRLDADLEAILLKALRKEPRDRYLTAEQLASDIRAWLQGLPVAARHGTVRYRACKFIRRNRLALAGTSALAVTLIAGVVGVVWQARVANEERRKAEARSADLRQLSNSLLSELDEAIKELPGSTGAQKLLVTRVLEHLDRMAKDAQGDRQTQLDLVNAYTQLGEIQGDPYVQNLGDPHAALISMGKAIDMATPLVASRPGDRDALRLLALAQQYKGDVLFGMDETEEAVQAMRVSSDAWDKLIASGDVTPGLLCDAGSAYGTLGDELGQNGMASLVDPVGAIAAYRRAKVADVHALAIDSHSSRAMRGISIYEMKIGSVMMETDPASAVKEFEAALQNANTLPDSEKSRLSTQRMRAMLMRKQAIALEQLGEYERSVPLFQQAIETERRIAALDSKDSRAQFDLVVVLDDTAQGYEDAADPALAAQPGEGRKNLMLARNYLAQATDGLERLLKMDPDHDEWRTLLDWRQVQLGAIDLGLHTHGYSNLKTKMALGSIRDLYAKAHLSPQTLDQMADAFLRAEPAQLKDPQWALSCAQREVSMSHTKTPSMLLTLAQAYRETGQIEKGRATAREGLALLPAPQPGSVKPRIRKLLEIQAQTAR